MNSLKREMVVLRSLIHRNYNQHRRAKYFSFLKRISKLLGGSVVDNLSENFSATSKFVKTHCSITKKKASWTSQDVTDTLRHVSNMQSALRISITSIIALGKGIRCLSIQLGCKVFLPLLSMLLAVSARILKLISSFSVACSGRNEILLSNISAVAAMQPKYSEANDRARAIAALSSEQERILCALKAESGASKSESAQKNITTETESVPMNGDGIVTCASTTACLSIIEDFGEVIS